ncbi:iron-containing alcohol dehydrogenase family protein [Alicycliphilus denitrificans]|uniref:iron-containing alcohol dehydrogenase family protein n=1 Tax=Alicycliphilus denitrificans TaxID=179636 RepID=UPI00384B9A21
MKDEIKHLQSPLSLTGGCISWPGVCYWGDDALASAIQAAGPRLRHPLVVTDAAVWRAVGPAVQLSLATAPGLQWHVYDGVSPNPTLAQVRAALDRARAQGCASIVAVGGGSAIDVAKLVFACLAGGLAVEELPTPRGQAWLAAAAMPDDPLFLAIPTTAGTGSESSSAALIQGEDGRKRLFRSLRTRPALVALQPQLTLSLPFGPTAQGGFDALLHALGAWVNTDPSPIGKAMALHALRLCLQAYPAVLRTPDSLQARAEMQMGAYMAGVAIGMSKVDAVHGMCTPLEARMHMAHAEVLAPVFSVVARYTVQTHARPYADAARALGMAHTGGDQRDALALIEAVESLARQGRIATRFADLRLSDQDAGQLAAQALQSASTPLNPRPLMLEEIKSLYLQLAM